MKKLFTSLVLLSAGLFAYSQTTEYETGYSHGDGWTGWSTPVTTNVSGSSVNGVYIYSFTGTGGNAYTIEIKRQFTINTSDMDLYFTATAENATGSIEISTDDVSYSSLGSQAWPGGGASQSTLLIPTVDPGTSTFWLKLKMEGTFGSPSSVQFYSFYINAVLNGGGAGVEDLELGSNVIYSNNQLQFYTNLNDYMVDLYDITGKAVLSKQNPELIDLSDLNNGIYFVAIRHEGRRKTFKIVRGK